MSTRNRSGSHVDRRRNYPAGVHRFKQRTGSNNIDDGIHCSHFVEMDFPGVFPVNSTFRLGQQGKSLQGLFLDKKAEGTPVDNFLDLRQSPVRMTLLKDNLDIQSGDSLSAGSFNDNMETSEV